MAKDKLVGADGSIKDVGVVVGETAAGGVGGSETNIASADGDVAIVAATGSAEGDGRGGSCGGDLRVCSNGRDGYLLYGLDFG